MASCTDLDRFFDRELGTEAQCAAFRDHLAGCGRCQKRLEGLMQEATVTHTPERTEKE